MYAITCIRYITAPTVVSINSISSNSPICFGGNLTLTSSASGGTGAIAYNWTGPNGFSATNQQNPSISSVTGTAAGGYNLSVTDVNGCSAASNTSVTVNALPTVSGTTPASRCGPGSITLGATTSAGLINWYAAPTGGASLYTGTSYTPTISGTTTFYVDATANGCLTGARTAVIATINTVPTITATSNSVVCAGSTLTLTGNVTSVLLALQAIHGVVLVDLILHPKLLILQMRHQVPPGLITLPLPMAMDVQLHKQPQW
jgi:hypothetical protein